MRNSLILLAVFLLFWSPLAVSAVPSSCEMVNGLLWCYNPQECNQSCNEVCAALGGQPIADDTVWFEAQNTEQKCTNIALAFGTTFENLAGYNYGCVEEQATQATRFATTAPGGIVSPLVCSTNSDCPSNLRTDADDYGLACGQEYARRAICPCENVSESAPIPALSKRAAIFVAIMLAGFGFTTIRRGAA